MNHRIFAFLLAFAPFLAAAQQPEPTLKRPGLEGFNAETRTVLLANRPMDVPQADWLKLMANPVNASLFPLRITQPMLDTLDAGKLDARFRYVLVREGR
ncbi:MAG: hypothetical protein IT230_05490 [Flavobacteriales bacterium]|nr:hypothetical protein [Flavobacteriales bacterium]